MPRQARQHVIGENIIYHIVSRGNNKQKIFRSSRDHKRFLAFLENVKRMFPFYLYSYCLMPNHYHLEIESLATPISVIMHRLNFLYAMYFKHQYDYSGHLFQDRFYSSLINKESYFWTAARYIEINPVRAGLVEKPEDYKWSSYSVYFQKNYEGKLINRDEFLKYDDENLEKARLSYLEFVSEGLKSEHDFDFEVNKNMI